MAKSGTFGMKLHQTLGFSTWLARVSHAEAVFWPGCALMQLDPTILKKTLEVLRREDCDMGVSTCCCGYPSRYLFQNAYQKRADKLQDVMAKRGVRRIYLACPNCQTQLKTLENTELISIWPVLAKHLRPEDLVGRWCEVVNLHDPCPLRKDGDSRAAVRQLLQAAGIGIEEPRHNGENTLCCGNFQMLRAREPNKSAHLRAIRMAEFDPALPVCAPCEGCLDAFRSAGLDTTHVLELLFGKSQNRGWGNRLKFTASVSKE